MLRITAIFFLIFTIQQHASAQCNGSPTQCLGIQSHTVNPAPVNGQYSGGTIVTFCYTIQDYNQCNSNWLHTVDINLGPGWDASTIAMVSAPASCDAVGSWDFYNNVTSTVTGLSFGPCFSYDSPSGSPGGVLDGNPGNNYGDNCSSYIWTFCFSVKVAVGCNNQNLSVDVNAIGDGTSGAWTWNVCPGAPYNICNAVCNSCPLSITSNVTNPTCADNDGFIEVFPDSAIGSVTYSWNPSGQTTSSINGLSSGTYIVTVTDSISCQVMDTFDLNYINPVSLNTQMYNASCYGYCDGSIYVFPSGGSSPYAYSWNTGQTASSDTALCAGTYYITVTDDNSCTRIDTVVIAEPSEIVLVTSYGYASCFGGSDGWANVVANGGAGNYSYSWSPSNQTTSSATNLYAATYTVVVTDLTGCFNDATVVIGSPLQILTNPVITDASCFSYNDGSISTNVTNGQSPYQYLWLHNGSTSSSVSDLKAGAYPLLVTDANGCTELDSMLVEEPELLTGTFDIKPASCPSATDGSINVLVTGGTLPYVYEWNYDPLLNSSGLYSQGEGIYTVEVIDAHNCIFTGGDIIYALPDFIVDAGRDTSIELGTFATLNAEVNRSGIFLYKWTPGYHLIDSFAATTEAYPYYTTTYTVYVTEASSGCKDNDSVTVMILPTDYILLPNAFTPNGDGLNDLFMPITGDMVSLESFKVFNRWGNMLFDDKTVGWDGTFNGEPEEIAAYVFEVTYKVEGRPGLYSQKGNVLLLR